jgi:hypothetical protein
VVDAYQADQVDGGTDFFGAFACSRVPRIFVIVDEPTRQAPEAAARFDRSTSQQDSTVNHDHDGG